MKEKWTKPKVVWPIYQNGKFIQDGTIDGIPTKEVWKRCQKQSRDYFRHKIKTNERFRNLMQEYESKPQEEWEEHEGI